MTPRRPATAVAALMVAAACADQPTAPEGGHPATLAIAPGSISVQVLPTSSGWSGGATAVSSGGAIFATNNGSAGRPLMAWLPPYSGLPVQVASSGVTALTSAGDNAAGDVTGLVPGTITRGTWIRGGPATWAFVANPGAGFLEFSTSGLNDGREMAGFVLVAGSGSNRFLPVYVPAPGAAPVVLPLPPGTDIVGGVAQAINSQGDIAGRIHQQVTSRRTTTSVFRAAFWRRTGPSTWTVTLLPAGGATTNSSAGGLNDAGQVVGYDGSSIVRWTPTGTGWTRAVVATSGDRHQIDGCGRVVGTAAIGGKSGRAFIWDGTLTALPLPAGASKSYAFDIATDTDTGAGVIVGFVQGNGNSAPLPARWTIPGCGQ